MERRPRAISSMLSVYIKELELVICKNLIFLSFRGGCIWLDLKILGRNTFKKMRETVKSSLSDCGCRGPEISEREKEETMWHGYGTRTVGLHIHSGTCSVI